MKQEKRDSLTARGDESEIENFLQRHSNLASYQQLAQNDYPAVIRFAWEVSLRVFGNDLDACLALVGNSLGGHLLPLSVHAIQSGRFLKTDQTIGIGLVLLINTSSGYPGYSRNKNATELFYAEMSADIVKRGYLRSRNWGLGNSITRTQAQDWIAAISTPSWFASLPHEWAKDALSSYTIPTLSIVLSDDQLLVQGSARRADAYLRALGSDPVLTESLEEKNYWEADNELLGAYVYRHGQPPSPNSAGHRRRNGFTLTRLLFDVKYNEWTAKSSDCGVQELGHINWAKRKVGYPNSRSKELWVIMEGWLSRDKIPSMDDPVLGGAGGRLDFGLRDGERKIKDVYNRARTSKI